MKYTILFSLLMTAATMQAMQFDSSETSDDGNDDYLETVSMIVPLRGLSNNDKLKPDTLKLSDEVPELRRYYKMPQQWIQQIPMDTSLMEFPTPQYFYNSYGVNKLTPIITGYYFKMIPAKTIIDQSQELYNYLSPNLALERIDIYAPENNQYNEFYPTMSVDQLLAALKVKSLQRTRKHIFEKETELQQYLPQRFWKCNEHIENTGEEFEEYEN